MALDPSIPLSVARQPGINPLAVMSAVTQMRQQERLEAEAAAEREERKQTQTAAKQEAALKAVARAMLPLVKMTPEQRAAAFTRTVRPLIDNGSLPGDFDDVYTPGVDDQFIDSALSKLMTDAQLVEPYLPQKPAPPVAPREYEVEVVLPDGTTSKKLISADEYRKGVPQAQKPTPEDKPPTLGSFEDYVVKWGATRGKAPAQLTDTDIEAARKAYNQADDRALASGGGSQYFTPIQTAQGVFAFDNRTGRVVGRVADLKPGETAQREIANAQTVLTMMQAITAGLTPEKIGPIAGRFNTVEAAVTGDCPLAFRRSECRLRSKWRPGDGRPPPKHWPQDPS